MDFMDLVIFPFHDYKKWIKEGFRTRDAHLFQSLKENSKVNRIIIFNRPVSIVEATLRKGWITSKDNIIFNKKNLAIQEISPNIFVVDMLIYDLSVIWLKKLWWKKVYEHDDVIKKITFSINYLNSYKPNILIQNPMCSPIIERVEFSSSIFDAIDNWLEHPQMNSYYDEIKKSYLVLDKNVDVITMVSKSLEKIFNRKNNIFWIPNGVDFTYFHVNETFNDPISLGYAGKIQSRLDFKLIEKVLMSFPDVVCHFFGPVFECQNEVAKLKKTYKNAFFYGDIHYDELPMYFDKFDIGIIPHKVNEFTESMNPLKLYEFIRAGKPVVTTKVAGVDKVSDYVYISEDEEQFIANLNIVISEIKLKNISTREISESLSDTYSWDEKADEILSLFGR